MAIGAACLPGHAATDRIKQTKRALSQELRFQAFDKIDLGPAERCPGWLDVRPDDMLCKRLTVIYRGVYLSGMLIEHTVQTDALTIFHVGHESNGKAPQTNDAAELALSEMPVEMVYEDAAWFISRLFDRKANVLVLFMPGSGMNPLLTESEPVRRTHRLLGNHNAFSLLDFPEDSAATYFVAHVKAFLDRYGKPYRKVNMIGRSGGGWATTIAAATEPRIQCSISFFGTLPIRLRLPVQGDSRDDLGDFEQYGFHLYKRLDYTDLYALAATPSGRRHTQVYNFKDNCCFSGEVKGAKVPDMFKALYPNLRSFHVDILPIRSANDHGNLETSALSLVDERCPSQ